MNLLECYNFDMKLSDFASFLYDKCGVKPGDKVLVGLSGGADSQCLLHLLIKNGVHTVAAHFNHHLRLEADKEAEEARVFAKGLDCEFILGTADVNQYAESNRLSLEEAARILRYSFLFSEAERLGASAVAVAHQADDQVETMLMHLLRGAGISGLKAMSFRSSDPLGLSNLPLIRPLLGIWRQEIEEYCKQNGLKPSIDQSNFDAAFYRNRIRLELIPELETYNPQVKKHLWQTAYLLNAEHDLLENQAKEFLEKVIEQQGKGWILINVKGLLELPDVFQSMTIRSLIFKLRNSIRDVDFEMVRSVREFIHGSGHGGKIQLAHGVDVLSIPEQRCLFMLRGRSCPELWPQMVSNVDISIHPGQKYPINEFWVFETRLADNTENISTSPWSASLDFDTPPSALKLTTRREGDIFEPFGMNGKCIKLGDFWTNEHLPAIARGSWPILRGDNSILWIPGFRIADSCRVKETTRRILICKLTKVDES